MTAGPAPQAVLSSAQIAKLQVLFSSATANAATSLGGMIDQPVLIETMNVREIGFAEAQGLAGNPEEPVAAIYLVFEGGLTGHIVLLFGLPAALRLVDLLMLQDPGTATELDELSQSALGEVGNQTGSAFLNSLADAMGLDARISPPAVLVDMAAAVLNSVISQVSIESDNVIMVDTKFIIGRQHAPGLLLVIPNQASLRILAGGLD